MKHTYKINKILVPIDFSESSENTLNHAIAIAKKSNSELILVHVLGVSSHVFPNLTEESNTSSLLMEKVDHEMSSLLKELKSTNNIEVSGQIVEGSPSVGIVEVAESRACDLIVMGTHGVSGFQEFFMGSVAYRVVNSSKCPVLTINQTAKVNDYGTILVPIDSSMHTKDKVSEVTTLAKLFNSKVKVVGLVTEDHQDEEKFHRAKIKQVEEHFSVNGIEFESKIIHGEDLTEMLNSYAQAVDADLIAIMTEQEASTGLFVGPHAQRIVNHFRIPVLSVTPITTLDLTSQGNIRPFHS